MAAIRSRDTSPELVVRKRLHAAGLRFRLHRRDLPGTPDVVLTKHSLVIFVHGCFWHGHECKKAHVSRSNGSYWLPKIERNRARDQTAVRALRELGWRVAVIWECKIEQGLAGVFRRVHK